MARTISLTLLTISTLLWATGTHAEESDACVSCHALDDHPSMQALQQSPHNFSAHGADESLAQQPCSGCHGTSTEHASKPTLVSPEVSYGPRWSSDPAKQAAQCMNCHEDDAGKHWDGSLHQQEKLICTNCHSGHAAKDEARGAGAQRELCTVCHKPQQDGIHKLQAQLDNNPPCSQCHSPHANPSAQIAMLNNRSAGCAHCHNLVAMSQASGANPTAVNYHKTMAQPGRLCTDCHQYIAHADTEGIAPVVAQAVRKKRITLFTPGQSDAEWLISRHAGAQPLRQGLDCEQCHRDEERIMGEQLANRGLAASREIDVAFAANEEQLRVRLSWQGPAEAHRISMMWGNDGNKPFRRGGCWAVCHNDMPGMSQDRGQQQSKYLWVSRAQQQRIGQPARLKPQAELDQLLSEGNFVEIWQADIASAEEATLRGGTVLDQLTWRENSAVGGEVQYEKGRWTVTFTRPLKGGPGNAKSFLPDKHYTFGVALHSAELPAEAHWVSLPMTFSLNDRETDFVIRR